MQISKTEPIASTFLEITPDTWEQAKELGILLTNCVFRGHEDNRWQLTTTLERAATQFNCPPENLWLQEKQIINQFRSRAHHYISSPPKDNEYIEWLSLIQHYGGPTRLLDFTRSFYIASFFAVETAKHDACVWGINFLLPLFDAINNKYLVYDKSNILEAKELDFVLRVEPTRLNERLAIQQGTFLFPFTITKSFEQNLCATFSFPFDSLASKNSTEVEFKTLQQDIVLAKESLKVIKINLPRKWHKSIMIDLNSMNINSVSLFPGLDGFARSLRLIVRKMEQPFL